MYALPVSHLVLCLVVRGVEYLGYDTQYLAYLPNNTHESCHTGTCAFHEIDQQEQQREASPQVMVATPHTTNAALPYPPRQSS